MKVGLFITNQQTLDTDMVTRWKTSSRWCASHATAVGLAHVRPALPQRGQQQAAADGALPGPAGC